MARTRAYRDGLLVAEGFHIVEISEYLEVPGTVVWLDLFAPEKDVLEVAAAEFGLHALAVEDALHRHQRPKIDTYPTHRFLNVYSVELDDVSGELVSHEAAAFITQYALITVRKDEGFDIDGVVAQWDANAMLAVHGMGFLLYGLLDHVVDGHFEAVQSLDEEIEKLEDLLFDDHPRSQALERRSFELRKSLVLLRRVVLPMREVLNTLMRRDLDFVDPDMAPYFQDVYDHVLRAQEWTESLRDLVGTIRETHLTVQGNRLNVITKKVTSWAAIIAVPTAITGWYGQNVPYPGFGQLSGLLTSAALIAIGSVGLFVLFRRLDWL